MGVVSLNLAPSAHGGATGVDRSLIRTVTGFDFRLRYHRQVCKLVEAASLICSSRKGAVGSSPTLPTNPLRLSDSGRIVTGTCSDGPQWPLWLITRGSM